MFSINSTPVALTALFSDVRDDVLSVYQMTNQRPGMEDTYCIKEYPEVNRIIIGVFDGHSGNKCARYLSTELADALKEATMKEKIVEIFETKDHYFIDNNPNDRSGSTAVIAIIDYKTSIITIVNLGDSQALILKNNQVLVETKRHCVSEPSEKEYIESFDGFKVDNNNRILSRFQHASGINISRAFGDVGYKLPHKILRVIPDIYTVPIEDCSELLLFSDGILENNPFVDSAEIADFYSKNGAKSLIEKAQLKSYDNLTLLTFKLKPMYIPLPPENRKLSHTTLLKADLAYNYTKRYIDFIESVGYDPYKELAAYYHTVLEEALSLKYKVNTIKNEFPDELLIDTNDKMISGLYTKMDIKVNEMPVWKYEEDSYILRIYYLFYKNGWSITRNTDDFLDGASPYKSQTSEKSLFKSVKWNHVPTKSKIDVSIRDNSIFKFKKRLFELEREINVITGGLPTKMHVSLLPKPEIFEKLPEEEKKNFVKLTGTKLETIMKEQEKYEKLISGLKIPVFLVDTGTILSAASGRYFIETIEDNTYLWKKEVVVDDSRFWFLYKNSDKKWCITHNYYRPDATVLIDADEEECETAADVKQWKTYTGELLNNISVKNHKLDTEYNSTELYIYQRFSNIASI